MRVTVCELAEDRRIFVEDWERLVRHVQSEASQLVVLPEMTFFGWFPSAGEFDPLTWTAAVRSHEEWMIRLNELIPAIVIASRPVQRGTARYQEAYCWNPESGCQPLHRKRNLPNEQGYWEAAWYRAGRKKPAVFPAAASRASCLVCSEIWRMEHAEAFSRSNVHRIATPRATILRTTDTWLAAGRTAAVIAGSYSLSSNRTGSVDGGMEFGGRGWICDPEGAVLAITSVEQPAVTLEIDLETAVRAKRSYPRYLYGHDA